MQRGRCHGIGQLGRRVDFGHLTKQVNSYLPMSVFKHCPDAVSQIRLRGVKETKQSVNNPSETQRLFMKMTSRGRWCACLYKGDQVDS